MGELSESSELRELSGQLRDQSETCELSEMRAMCEMPAMCEIRDLSGVSYLSERAVCVSV